MEIRDLKTHLVLPGIENGDIGTKIGYSSKPNGYLILNNVRIPRSQLLQKFVNVDRDGNFSIEGDLRVLYSIMMFIRVNLVQASCWYLLNGSLITTRYSICRKQFSTLDNSNAERPIIDYQT